ESSAPQRDASDELRQYPADLIHAPLDLRSAGFTFTAGTQAVPALAIARPPTAPSRYGGKFASLVTRHGLTPWVVAGMLALALLFGAAHALAPGHGKTVMAAYLVGTKGRPMDAAFLGIIVSAMHTFSVLVLGLVLVEVNRSTPIDRVYPALTLIGGLAVMAVGGWMLVSRLCHRRAHRHGHHHEHPAAPLSRKGLAVLATSGGILPSPSAVIVL